MNKLISDELYNILSQISDQDFDSKHIIEVFRNELPKFAPQYGFVRLKSCVFEPIKRSSEMQVTETMIYDASNGADVNEIGVEFPIGNGGRVIVSTAIAKDAVWTEELKKVNYVLNRLVYLLLGRANSMQMLAQMRMYDQLTGIPNENTLTQFMGQTIGQGRFHHYYTNFLNIKNMKLINNRYGKPAGDAVMYGFAHAINDFAQQTGNGIAARLGGDNYLAFIEDSKENAFLEFLQKIVVDYKKEDGQVIPIKVDSRLGYYQIQPRDGIQDAMHNSDFAAKLSKNEEQPDVLQFEETMKFQMLKMRQLEQSIPDAIKNREFVVYYQPKADISDAEQFRFYGAEALVRWAKDGQIVAPGEFIPVLEKSGLVTELDFYVLEQVCVDIKDWLTRGMEPVKISSNFSRRHLQNPEFANQVEEIIKKHGVDSKYIEIEITESYDDEDLQALTRFEQRMHTLGVDLSVDDFGSGFSSLKMIKKIVADTIKLDKSIVDDIGDGGADDIIISHIIHMINCLGKNLIAEGVETKEQADFLRENGCHHIQGFLFARPCPKEEFETYFEN